MIDERHCAVLYAHTLSAYTAQYTKCLIRSRKKSRKVPVVWDQKEIPTKCLKTYKGSFVSKLRVVLYVSACGPDYSAYSALWASAFSFKLLLFVVYLYVCFILGLLMDHFRQQWFDWCIFTMLAVMCSGKLPSPGTGVKSTNTIVLLKGIWAWRIDG